MLLSDLIEFDPEPRLAALPPRPFAAVTPPPLARRLINRLWDAFSPVVHAQSYPYKQGVYGHIYSYGLGGPSIDGVTAQQGWTEWEHYNFNTAHMLHSGGWYCTSGLTYPPQGCLFPLQLGNPMAVQNIGWQPLQMGYRDVYWGPAWLVGRLDWSQFRYNPNTWNHTLYVRRNALGNGTATCPMWVDGAVLGGTYQLCFYYNLPWPWGFRP